ncbi:MAG: nuclear transport factor 2 family protein [bacterium]
MDKQMLLFIFFLISSLTTVAQDKVISLDDETAIRQTVLNYAEGWYSGNSERMGKALSPDLAKRGIFPTEDGKGTQIYNASYKQMLEWTKMQPNKLKDNPGVVEEVKILDLGQNIATVKCVMKDFIDILQLAKINNEWKILNAIWEPNTSKTKLD